MITALAIYDLKCLVRVAKLLVLVIEWLNVSQKTVERAMIVIYLLLVNACPLPYKTGTRLLLSALMALVLWLTQNHRPRIPFIDERYAAWRGMMQIVLLLFTVVFDVFAPPHHWQDVFLVVAQIDLIVFMYSVSFYVQGKRKRMRELSEDMKKWLATLEWLPVGGQA